MNRPLQAGFTLWELLVALLVAGILFGIGVPNVMEFQRNSNMSSAANDLVTGILMARAEAVKRQVPVALCLSANPAVAMPTCLPNAVANNGNVGFIVWVDENGDFDAAGNPDLTDATDGNAVVDNNELVLMRSVPPADPIQISANCGHIAYAPNGWVRQVAGLCAAAFGTPQFFLFCDDRGRRVAAGGLSSARAVRIDATGRGIVLHETVQVDPAIATTGATCP
jgi:prepilin-type N-terminal cleavage/methylation domain-containing protein